MASEITRPIIPGIYQHKDVGGAFREARIVKAELLLLTNAVVATTVSNTKLAITDVQRKTRAKE